MKTRPKLLIARAVAAAVMAGFAGSAAAGQVETADGTVLSTADVSLSASVPALTSGDGAAVPAAGVLFGPIVVNAGDPLAAPGPGIPEGWPSIAAPPPVVALAPPDTPGTGGNDGGPEVVGPEVAGPEVVGGSGQGGLNRPPGPGDVGPADGPGNNPPEGPPGGPPGGPLQPPPVGSVDNPVDGPVVGPVDGPVVGPEDGPSEDGPGTGPNVATLDPPPQGPSGNIPNVLPLEEAPIISGSSGQPAQVGPTPQTSVPLPDLAPIDRVAAADVGNPNVIGNSGAPAVETGGVPVDLYAEPVTMYATTGARVRAGPGTSFAQVGTAAFRQAVTVLGEASGTGWLYLELPDGTRGFTSESLLSVNQPAVASPNPGPSNPPPQQVTPTCPAGQVAVFRNDTEYFCVTLQ